MRFSFAGFEYLFKRQMEQTGLRAVYGSYGNERRVFGFITYDPEHCFMVYITPRRPEHVYKKGDGTGPSFGISDEAIEDCKRREIKMFAVRYSGPRGVEWFAVPHDVFLEHCFSHIDERVREPQTHLPLSKFPIRLRNQSTPIELCI